MKNLLVENLTEEIFLLKINRPKVLNALNTETLQELLDLLTSLGKNTACRTLIVTGAGDKSFIAGADIKEMQEMNPIEMMTFSALGQQVTLAFAASPFVIIAAVNGYALGGGLEMALAADFIYAAGTAKFGLPEVSLGIIPAFGGTQRLSRAIGIRRAKELTVTGRMFGAEEAKEWGIVNKICPLEELLPASVTCAQEILQHSRWAVAQAKRAIDVGCPLGLTEALELEKNMCATLFSTEERAAKMTAFLHQRSKS